MEKENGIYHRTKSFLIRVAVGVLMVAILNPGFKRAGIEVQVGINPISAVTAGILGIPGVAMLYGMAGSEYLLELMSDDSKRGGGE